MFKASAFIHGDAINDPKLKECQLFSAVDGALIGTIPLLDDEHKIKLFESSKEGFKKWSQVDAETREKYLFLFGSKLKEHQKWLTQLIQLESGKGEKEAEKEVIRSVEYITESVHAFHYLHKNPREFNSEKYPLIPENLQAVYLRVPLGVVLSITPFNYPLNSVITKIVPAILMGNSVIQKSAMNGALTGWLVCKIFNDLRLDGFLITPGVLNYYTGSGSELQEFLESKQVGINALSFTGSRESGISIARALPGIPQSLELSAINVALVLENASLKLTAQEILNGAFTLSGQRCTSLQLACIPKSIFGNFLQEITLQLNDIKIKQTPIVNSSVFEKIKEAYDEAIFKGARVVTNQINWNLLKKPYLENIVLSGVSFDMKIAREELFGPILGLIEYTSIEDTIEKINQIGYGLQSSIFGKNFNQTIELASKLDVGRININMAPARSPDFLPFPSSRKSGNSEQGIINSLYFFSKFRGVVYQSTMDRKKIDEK